MERITNALVVLRDALTEDGLRNTRAELIAENRLNEQEWYGMLLHNLQKLNSILGNTVLNLTSNNNFNRESFTQEELMVFSNTR